MLIIVKAVSVIVGGVVVATIASTGTSFSTSSFVTVIRSSFVIVVVFLFLNSRASSGRLGIVR